MIKPVMVCGLALAAFGASAAPVIEVATLLSTVSSGVMASGSLAMGLGGLLVLGRAR